MTYAEKGCGAFLNCEAIKTSDRKAINQVALSTGNLATIAQKPQWQNLGQLISQVNRIRGYGDFYHYHLLASGKIDLVIESDVNILDIAALSIIVNEAGGKFTDLSGNALNLETTTVLAANSTSLHETILPQINYH